MHQTADVRISRYALPFFPLNIDEHCGSRKLPDRNSYPVTELFDRGSLSVAISSIGTGQTKGGGAAMESAYLGFRDTLANSISSSRRDRS